jgi:hypothetical protein
VKTPEERSFSGVYPILPKIFVSGGANLLGLGPTHPPQSPSSKVISNQEIPRQLIGWIQTHADHAKLAEGDFPSWIFEFWCSLIAVAAQKACIFSLILDACSTLSLKFPYHHHIFR